jgi:choline-sulfatase
VALANAPDDMDRTAFSEYHAVGAATAFYMVRWDHWKFVHYEGDQPQLFDLDADPYELKNLAGDPASAAALAEGKRRLAAICDPAEVTARAFRDQARRVEELGGAETVMAMRSYPYTPAPGEAPRYA